MIKHFSHIKGKFDWRLSHSPYLCLLLLSCLLHFLGGFSCFYQYFLSSLLTFFSPLRTKSGTHGSCLSLSDHDRLRIFVQEFVVRGLIPWAERMLRTLNEQVNSYYFSFDVSKFLNTVLANLSWKSIYFKSYEVWLQICMSWFKSLLTNLSLSAGCDEERHSPVPVQRHKEMVRWQQVNTSRSSSSFHAANGKGQCRLHPGSAGDAATQARRPRIHVPDVRDCVPDLPRMQAGLQFRPCVAALCRIVGEWTQT